MSRKTIRSDQDWDPPAVLKVFDPGIGKAFCGGGGFVNWVEPGFSLAKKHDDDCDGFVCITPGQPLPIVPIRAIHAFNRSEGKYKYIPIRFSLALLAKTYLRCWMWIPMMVALFLLIIVWDDWSRNPDSVRWAAKGSLILAGSSALTYLLLHNVDRRHRNIRLIIGPHCWGSSDPATWTEATLRGLPEKPGPAGVRTFADGVAHYLRRGNLCTAMWCARISVARENRERGEELTEEVLADLRAIELLKELRVHPMSSMRGALDMSLVLAENVPDRGMVW